jgi:hypothetical protein
MICFCAVSFGAAKMYNDRVLALRLCDLDHEDCDTEYVCLPVLSSFFFCRF